MRRGAASAVAILAVLGASMLGGVAVGQESEPPGPGPADDDPVSATLESIATCVRSRNRLLLVFEIDESGSLFATDPGFERVDAALAALDSFRRLATNPSSDDDGPPLIEAFVAGFAREFTPRSSWGDLSDPDELAAIEAAIAGERETPLAADTDIPLALDGAQRELADRSAAIGGEEPCKVVLFFTDGEYALGDGPDANRDESPFYAEGIDLSVPGSAGAAMAAGVDYLCGSGGVADTLRNDGAVILTTALVTEIAPADRDFLAAISTGASGSTTCGTDASPSYGAFLPAESVDDLLPIFDRIAQGSAGGTTVRDNAVEGICIGAPCEEGRLEFALEPGVAGFSSTSRFGEPGVSVLVSAPDGATATIEPDVAGSSDLAGTDLSWDWIDSDTVRLDGRTPTADRDEWTGDWALTYLAPTEEVTGTKPDTSLSFFGALRPALVGTPELVRGEDTTIAVDVVDETGSPADPVALDASVDVTFVLTDRTTGDEREVSATSAGDSRWEASVDTPSDLATTTLDLEAQVRVTTAGGRILAPLSQIFPLPVHAAQRFPTVLPSELRPASVRGAGSTAATITIRAGDEDAACVWITGIEIAASPTDLTTSVEPDATTRETCITLAPGAEATLDVRFANAQTSRGTARGAVTATIDAGEAGSETISIPFAFDLAPPINEAERVGLFAAIFGLGVVAPIGALTLLHRRLARFRAHRPIRVATVPLLVERTITQILRVFAVGEASGTTVLRVTDDGLVPDVLAPGDFGAVPPPTGAIVDVGGLRFEAHAPLNPFADPYATVRVAGRAVRARVVGDETADEDALPLALPATWIVTSPASDLVEVAGEFRGEALPGGQERIWVRVDLTVFVVDGDLAPQLAALVRDLGERLSLAANSIADAYEEAAAMRRATQ